MICSVCGAEFNSIWPNGIPIWSVCFKCIYRGQKLFCDKCTRNSFAPCGAGKSDQWEGRNNDV